MLVLKDVLRPRLKLISSGGGEELSYNLVWLPDDFKHVDNLINALSSKIGIFVALSIVIYYHRVFIRLDTAVF